MQHAITPGSIHQAIRQALATVEDKGDRPWRAAIIRAERQLLSLATRWAFDGDVFTCESATEPGVTHRVTARGCDCKAYLDGHRPCWHRAARRLLQKASQMGQQQQHDRRMITTVRDGRMVIDAYLDGVLVGTFYDYLSGEAAITRTIIERQAAHVAAQEREQAQQWMEAA